MLFQPFDIQGLACCTRPQQPHASRAAPRALELSRVTSPPRLGSRHPAMSNTTPQLPYELTAKIIRAARDELLIEDRSRPRTDPLPTTPPESATTFLFSASLVSQTWRNISQYLLLSTAIVGTGNGRQFTREVARQGVATSLPSIRLGHVMMVKGFRQLDDQGATLASVISNLPGLKAMECVGAILNNVARAFQLVDVVPPGAFVRQSDIPKLNRYIRTVEVYAHKTLHLFLDRPLPRTGNLPSHLDRNHGPRLSWRATPQLR